VRLADFEAMIRRMAAEVPEEYLDGVAEVQVSRATLPHPDRAEIYTLGECIPLPALEADPEVIQSRIVLYHGSFRALAALDPGFDWRDEAWETLTHELRHHLEWRASAPDLEALDEAAEANFARHDGEPFDPLFYLDGERVAENVYRIDHDYFLDHLVRKAPERLAFRWHGRPFEVRPPAGASLPAFLSVAGVTEPPPGELVLVLRPAPRLRDLFRRLRPSHHAVEAAPGPAA
jgi:hypothetical protein